MGHFFDIALLVVVMGASVGRFGEVDVLIGVKAGFVN